MLIDLVRRLMLRARSPKKRRDEWEYPIRMRYITPPWGQHWPLDDILEFLRINCANATHNSDMVPGHDSISFYFKTMEDAERFGAMMEENGIELCVDR